MKKILLISNMYPHQSHPYYGVFVRNIEKDLEFKNYSIIRAVIKGPAVSKINKLWKYIVFFIRIGCCFFKKYDFIYLHYISHSYFPLMFLQPIFRKKLLVHIHGGDIIPENRLSAFTKFRKLYVAKKAIKNSNYVIVPSNYYKEKVISMYNISPQQVFVYPSGGVDHRKFFVKEKKEQENFVLGYVGRIASGKGLETLVEAFSLLAKEDSDIRLVIVGDGEYKFKIRELIAKKELDKKISLPGSLPHAALVEEYNKFDCFIFPTERYESLGLVGLEAMACGKVVIGSDIGGLRDYVKEGFNGLFFRPGDALDLAEKITIFSNLPQEKKEAMSQNARLTAAEYDSAKHADRLDALFRSI